MCSPGRVSRYALSRWENSLISEALIDPNLSSTQSTLARSWRLRVSGRGSSPAASIQPARAALGLEPSLSELVVYAGRLLRAGDRVMMACAKFIARTTPGSGRLVVPGLANTNVQAD